MNRAPKIFSSSEYIYEHLPKRLTNWLKQDKTPNIDILTKLPVDLIIPEHFHKAEPKGSAYRIASGTLKRRIEELKREDLDFAWFISDMDDDDEFWMKRAIDRDKT